MEPRVYVDKFTSSLGMNYWTVRVLGVSERIQRKMQQVLMAVFNRPENRLDPQFTDGILCELYISDAHGLYPSRDHVQGCLRTVWFMETNTRAEWLEP